VLAFSPDGRRALLQEADCTELRLRDVTTGEIVLSFGDLARGLCDFGGALFSADGQRALISATLVDLVSGRLLRGLPGGSAFSPDGDEILGLGYDDLHAACLFDAGSGQLLRTFEGPESYLADVVAVSFSPDSLLVTTDRSDGVVDVWDLRDRAAGLRASRVGGKLELRWELGVLQFAESANGPWQDVTNAVSPFQVDLASGARFYRVKVEE
jgi:WD40 repeat protein